VSLDPWCKATLWPDGIQTVDPGHALSTTLRSSQLSNRVLKVPLGSDEYLLVENREADLNGDNTIYLDRDSTSSVILGPGLSSADPSDSLGNREYDFLLLDCPPNLSLVTVNALVACEEALVPIEAQTYSIKAISDLTNTVALIRSRLGRGVSLRFLPTKIDGRLKVGQEILEAIRGGLKERVLPPIRTDANLVRAPMLRAPVGFAFPRSKGAKDYARLAETLLREPPAEATAGRPAAGSVGAPGAGNG